MYFINYASGATRWAKELDVKSLVPQFSTNSLVSVIDAEKSRMMIRTKTGIGWVEIPEIENISDEDLKAFNESF